MKFTKWLPTVCIVLLTAGSLLVLRSSSPRNEQAPADPACCKVNEKTCPANLSGGEVIHESLSRQLLSASYLIY